jgi:heme exporter protein A
MLKVEDLEFGFHHRLLFKDVSFTVNAGELLHIVGPNGAGKSTLMSIIAGLIGAPKGSISFSGSDDRRLYLEYLPAEANGLYLKMSAMQNLTFWSALRGRQLPDESIHAALAIWDLNKPLLRDNFPLEKFSTGMKRRLALARLSLSPAPCWLLDEPFYGLDQNAAATFKEQLRKHLQSGGMGLIISHEPSILDGLVTAELDLTAKSERRP